MLKKPKTYRNKKYLEWIRKQPCVVTGYISGIEAAHLRWGSNAGTGQKPSDYWTLPLDHHEHAKQHQIGEKSYWISSRSERTTPHELVIEHLMKYIKEHDVRQEYAIINALENYIEENL